jgi:hypothetical protein
MHKSTLGSAILASLVLFTPACNMGGSDDGSDQTKSADIMSGNPKGKDNGGGCTGGHDCKSGVCKDAACTACKSNDDCGGGVCNAGTCAAPGQASPPPSASDGIKNGDETDVDCGGSSAPPCKPGQGCATANDCDSKVCGSDAKCAAPRGDDGVKNGDESDIDCGGTTTGAPKCGTSQACNVHADCASDGCDDTKHCALERSCTQTNGGLTCGTGEVGEAGADHESCCTSLPIPGRATRLDKYKVTAGRMRAFIDRVDGDVLGWYESNKGALSAAAVSSIEPYKGYLPTSRTAGTYAAEFALGGTTYLTDRPSNLQGCFVGNASNQAYGAHTWWNGTMEGEDRGFDQAFLDRLPLNCVTYPVMAAFCAWDGGRLQTFEENATAYGGSTYPYGNTPAPGGFREVNNVFLQVGPATQSFTTTACPGCNSNVLNWSYNYQFPAGGNAAKPWDYAYWISAPGRFPMDAGPGGHRDIGGLMIELTSTPGNNADPKYGPTVKWSKQGSWEGHGVGYANYEFAIQTKYGKTGGRCARD